MNQEKNTNENGLRVRVTNISPDHLVKEDNTVGAPVRVYELAPIVLPLDKAFAFERALDDDHSVLLDVVEDL